jgi:hypothetical protein
MGDFYGHNVAAFVPSFSWIDTLGKDLSAIPEAMQVEKDLNEGRISNDQIYTGVVNMVKDIPDDEFEKSFEMPKQTFLSYAKPAKNEKPDMYLARSAKLTEKGNKALIDKKGYKAYLDEITKRNAAYEQHVQAIGAEGQPDFVGPSRTMMANPPTPLSPTEVTGIGIEHGVSADKMAPQVQAATEQQYRQQMGGFKEGQTQSQFLSGVSGIPTEPTKEFSKTLQTDQQKAANKVKEDALLVKQKMHDDNLRLRNRVANLQQQKITSDERRQIITDKAKNEATIAALNIKIAGIKSGMAKTKDEYGAVNQEMMNQSTTELSDLLEQVEVLNDNTDLYSRLLKEKDAPHGGIVTRPAPAKNNDPLGIR